MSLPSGPTPSVTGRPWAGNFRTRAALLVKLFNGNADSSSSLQLAALIKRDCTSLFWACSAVGALVVVAMSECGGSIYQRSHNSIVSTCEHCDVIKL